MTGPEGAAATGAQAAAGSPDGPPSLPPVACGAPQLLAPDLAPDGLGESPFWHPVEQVLYWCDIPGQALRRFDPATGAHRRWDLPCEPGCAAPMLDGGLMLAMRDGLWRFDPDSGRRSRIAEPPYDPRRQRFNDGKADALGRLWVGTLDDAREPLAGLYCWSREEGLEPVASGVATSNGVAPSPDGRSLWWADTRGHAVLQLALDADGGMPSARRTVHRFEPRAEGQPLQAYGGRPDGAAVDAQGGYWVAMFEGARLVRLDPQGRLVQSIALPVRCPTMPCFGGHDLRTLYVTTACKGRPTAELAAEPWAGQVLMLRVGVTGLPSHLVHA